MEYSPFQFSSGSESSAMQEHSRRLMPFAMPVSSYFRKPSRIAKSTRNQSPKHLVRRKTTAAIHGHERLSSLGGLSQPGQVVRQEFERERPTSWHPTSFNHVDDLSLSHSQFTQPQYLPEFSDIPFSTTEVNGLITPLSLPLGNEPQIQELITPLEELSAQDYSTNYSFSNNFEFKATPYYFPDTDLSWQNSFQPFAPQFPPFQFHYPMQSQYHDQNAHFSNLNMNTAPPSPDILPIPNLDNNDVASPFVLGSPRFDKDELVGMGLYDKPRDVHSLSLLGGRSSPTGSMGLKLEESFVPPPVEDEDDQDDDDDDDEEEDVQQEEGGREEYLIPSTGPATEQVPAGYVDLQPFFFAGQGCEFGTVPNIDHMGYGYDSTYGWASGGNGPNVPYGWI